MIEEIMKYIGSEEYGIDLEMDHNGGWWVWKDVSYRFGLCKKCIEVGNYGKMWVFGDVFDVRDLSDEWYMMKFRDMVNGWSNIIDEIRNIMEWEKFRRLCDSGKCDLVFDRYNYEGCISLKWDVGLVDHLLGVDVLRVGSVLDKIRVIDGIEDELYEVGAMFCDFLGSNRVMCRFFRLDKVDNGYCIRFEHEKNLEIGDIDKRLELLFKGKDELCVKCVEEFRVMLGLLTL